MSVDPAGQFANAYGYASNPVILIDEDGNSFIIAALIGALIGTAVSGGTYSVNAAIKGNWDFKDFFKQMGLGALGGFVTGGIGTLGSSVATNMFYGAIGSATSHTLTSALTGQEMTIGGFGASLLGGLAGGLIPSYGGLNNLAGGKLASNAFRSIGGELLYGSAKGALVGGLSSTIETGSFKNFGRGAAMGALSGAMGTGAKMAWSGRIYNTGYESALGKASGGKSNSLYAPGFRKGGIDQARENRKAPENDKPGGFYNRRTGQITMLKNNPNYVGHEFKHYMQATESGPIDFHREYKSYNNYETNPFETDAQNFGRTLYLIY